MKVESEKGSEETYSSEAEVLASNHDNSILITDMPPIGEEDSRTPLSVNARQYLDKLIGQSPIFRMAKNQVVKISQHDVCVLILGETGTGKELVARAVHHLSARTERPFVPVNCGAIPQDLVENELFGHESGAFTGASCRKDGLIQEANGGTLFLDEIDALPLMAQVKLLRFLQDQEYRPIGSTKICHADLRIIAATNTSITHAIAGGKFRKDLYFRLNTVSLVLPRLCDRVEDIPQLADYFLKKYTREFDKKISSFSAGAQDMLWHYAWPGNVRELEHTVARAVVLSEGPIIQPEDLRLPETLKVPRTHSFAEAKAAAISAFERAYLHKLLSTHQGNVSRAARAAKKDRRVLRELLRKHQIDATRFKSTSPDAPSQSR